MNFLMDGFLLIIQRMGFVSVNTRFQIPPKKKSHVERLGERGKHGMSPKREMRCPGNMFRTMVIDSFAVCAGAPSCWNHTLAQSPPPQPTYWVLHIQKMSGSRGSLCTYIPDKRKHMVTLTAEMPQLLFHVYLPSLIGKPKRIDPLL